MRREIMIVSILLLVTSLTFAQPSPNTITGLIVDQNNNPVEGVTIRAATKAQTASVRADELLTTKTDRDGKFSFSTASNIKITSIKKDGYICTAGQIKKASKRMSKLMKNPPKEDPQPIIIQIQE